jgi:hypothetical protein
MSLSIVNLLVGVSHYAERVVVMNGKNYERFKITKMYVCVFVIISLNIHKI